jgi:hypothetical protein
MTKSRAEQQRRIEAERRPAPKRSGELDLKLAVAHGLRADWFCRDRLGFEPDPWQAKLLCSRARSYRRILVTAKGFRRRQFGSERMPD